METEIQQEIEKENKQITNQIEMDEERKCKRYVAEIDLYIFAEDDDEAKEILNNYIEKIRTFSDNSASATKLIEQPFGVLASRKVY